MQKCNDFNIAIRVVSPHNHRGNRVERTHKEIRKYFRVLLSSSGVTFDELVKYTTVVYNNSRSSALNGKSPSECLLGIPSPTFLQYSNFARDLPHQSSSARNSSQTPIWDEYVRQIQTNLAAEKLVRFQSITESIPEVKSYNIGDIVIVIDIGVIKLGSTIEAKGPYKVIEKRGNRTYQLEHVKSGNYIIRHARMLRPFRLNSDTLQSLSDNIDIVAPTFISNQNNVGDIVDRPPGDVGGLEVKKETNRSDEQQRYNLRARKR